MASPDELRHVVSPTPSAAPSTTPTASSGAHTLGPHVLGVRVVVRRLLPGRTGPTGGPAFTDVLGVAEQWDPVLVVRREDGTRVEVPHALIVSGKPVPPRPSPLLRVSPGEVQGRVRAMWAGESERLGEWWVQASPAYDGRVRRRANSALAYGDPGVPLREALDTAAAWLRARERPVEAAVEVGGTVEAALRALGWAEPADFAGHAVAVQVASVAQVRRALRALGGSRPRVKASGADGASLTSTQEADVLRLRLHVDEDGVEVARGAAELRGDWVCLHDLRTAPAHRRTGRATGVVDTLLGAAAERGATTAVLHVLTTNAPALALYDRLGFLTHHTATYLAPPG